MKQLCHFHFCFPSQMPRSKKTPLEGLHLPGNHIGCHNLHPFVNTTEKQVGVPIQFNLIKRNKGSSISLFSSANRMLKVV